VQRILTYHVVPGSAGSAEVVKMRSAKAVSGDTITITAGNGGVMVDNARVVKTDITASNGVIHVIDSVILPNEDQVTGLVLLTGATGYIGGRLLPLLEKSGRRVRCLARTPDRLCGRVSSSTDVVQGDCFDEVSLDRALAGVESAFYLVDSMSARSDFAAADRKAAESFGRAAARAGVRRIIYLGGLAAAAEGLSDHLKSRNDTGKVLRASGVPVVEFRASIIVGTGGLSFEMIRVLVERLPVMVCPRWIGTPTQPIAVDDVLACLMSALDPSDGECHLYDIGGPDVVSYGYALYPAHALIFREMLDGIARRASSSTADQPHAA
jgi:uncharacterized protein YbjT (DUF2867 family)